jgi:hypothetical protein
MNNVCKNQNTDYRPRVMVELYSYEDGVNVTVDTGEEARYGE